MVRREYGGSLTDFTTTDAGLVRAGLDACFWSARIGGDALTDVQAVPGAGTVVGGVYISGATGAIHILGPDGYSADGIWVSPNPSPSAPRYLLRATTIIGSGGGGGSVDVPDASSTAKGVVRLAGDLGGTAASPTVVKLNGQAPAAVATSGAYGDLSGRPVIPDTSGLLSKTEATATYQQVWKANTAYPQGAIVVSPLGLPVQAKAAFTTGATYSAADWNPLSGDASRVQTRVLALGTSITVGDGSSDAATKSWRALLPAQLKTLQGSAAPGLTVTNAGVRGDTSTAMLTRLRSTLPGATFDIAVIETSINDARIDLTVTTATAVANLRAMVGLVRLYGIRPVVLTAAPIDPAKWVQQTGNNSYGSDSITKANAINAAVRAACTELRCELVDLATAFNGGGTTDLVDGIHPNDTGHAAWALAIGRLLAGAEIGVVGTAPAPPTALTLAAAPGDGKNVLSITGGSGATSYALYRGTTVSGSPIATGFPYTDTGLTNGTAYSYVATATNAQGTVTSASVSATPAVAVAPSTDTGPAPTTLRGTPTYGAGKFGNGMSGGVLGVAPGQVTLTSGTIEMWAKVPSDTFQVITGNPDASNWWIGTYARASGGFTFSRAQNDRKSTANITDGAFHHLAVCFDSTVLRMFVDGALVNEVVGNFANLVIATAAPNALGIGGYGRTSGYDLNAGVVDEYHLSNGMRYTAAFTAPSATFTADANTVLLYHLNN